MRLVLFLIPLWLSSAGCSSQEDYARNAGIKDDPRALVTAPPAQPAELTDSDTRGDWKRTFEYRWPAGVSAQPELVKLLAAERDKTLAQEKSEWAAAVKDSPADCVSCGQRSFAMDWKVVADTPGFLSLSGDVSTYTGGAHGMYGLRSLVWDKQAKRALDGAALFRSPEALDAALGNSLCAALNAERAKRRGEPVRVMVEGENDFGFDSCQYTKDATVLLGSSNGQAFDRIGIWFGPYVAGSYAEGAYELNFPVNAAVLKAVKPEYLRAFAAKR